MSAYEATISSPLASATAHFNAPLDPADVDFLNSKLGHSLERQKNILLEEGQANRFLTILAWFHEALREGTAMALTKLLRTQLHADRDNRLAAGTRKSQVVGVPKLIGFLSPRPSGRNKLIAAVPSTVH